MLQVAQSQDVAVLRLAHGKVSALDSELLAALDQELSRIESGPASALVLVGSAGTFSAGVDLRRLLEGGEAYLDRFLPLLNAALERLFFCSKPVIAAVNGHAIAGGCVLACSADYRLMAKGKGRIGVPELLVGVPFPILPLEIMRFSLPPNHLQAALYTGAVYLPDEALSRGFVDELCEPEALEQRAVELAIGFASPPAASFARTKALTRQPVRDRLAAHRAAHDAEVRSLWASPEVRKAIESYVSKTLK